MGGIGKTTLALEVTHLCRERNPNHSNLPLFNGYIWTSARDKPDFGLSDVVREILYVLSHFEMTTKAFSQAEEISLAIRALAAEPRLLIIDNFETVRDEPLHKFLRDQLPSPSKVLITSRHHLQTGEKVVTVGGLDEDDALELLRVEASRLQIPLEEQDNLRLKVIASKSYGIPLVLRWAMESVFNGKSLEWVVKSLENATADDIFDYIFNLSLATLDTESRTIFQTLSLLPTWSSIEAIGAMNPTIAAIQERVSRLVSLCLLDDNRKLVQSDRRYQLPPFARYLASKEFNAKTNSVTSALQCGLDYYLNQIEALRGFDKSAEGYLESEFVNIENLLIVTRQTNDRSLLQQGIKLAAAFEKRDESRGNTLFDGLAKTVEDTGQAELTLDLLEARRNPYVMGRPVGPPTFFGRRELLDFIQANFEDDRVRMPVISLVGQRRIGKTSILMRLNNRVTDRCKYVFFDLQHLSLEVTLNSFLFALTRNLWRDLSRHDQNVEGELAEPKYDEFDDSPARAFSDFIERAQTHLAGRRLVLMLDELEMLFYQRSDTKLVALDLLSYFRSMVQTGAFGIITAGITPLSELQSSVVVSPFFNIAVSRTVSFLDREESIDLIQKPVYGLIKYDEQALDFMFRMTGGHPMMLQTLCHEVFSLCLATRKLNVTVEQVEAALQDVAFQEIYFFRHLMMQLEGRMERQVLATASKLECEEFTEERLISGMASEDIELSKLREVLRKCLRLEILSMDGKGNYRFPIGMLRRWVQATNLPEGTE
jgi:hypothetical protein